MRKLAILCIAPIYGVYGQSEREPRDEYLRLKVNDNRDNVASMLKKLIRVKGKYSTADDILNSGCWCQLLSPEYDQTNHGEPVNELDQACRRWYKCNQCTSIDDADCAGMSEVYGSPIFDQPSKTYSCPGAPGSCGHNSCQCDVTLAEDLSDLADEYSDEFHAVKGYFDHTSKCYAGGNAGPRTIDECCGEYPNRFPFSSEGGNRGCCGGKTFDSGNLMCCSDGTIQVQCEEFRESKSLCNPNPCENGSTCYIEQFSQLPACSCKNGFTGKYCETELQPQAMFDPCAAAPCENGGVCVADGIEFTCQCTASYFGNLCQLSVDGCADSPCENGGNCVVESGIATCECIGAFSGEFCQIDPCEASPCQNGAECELNDQNYPVCRCASGFYGNFCEYNYCYNYPCKNGAVCVAERDGARCNCASGYTGQYCTDQVSNLLKTETYNDAECKKAKRDFIFVIDASGSLRANSDYFKAGKDWIFKFLSYFDMQKCQVGIVSFADDAQVHLPLKHNPAMKVKKRLGQVFAKEEKISSLNSGLLLADSMINVDSDAVKDVIVLSDFWSTDHVFPYEASIKLSEKGATVHSVGLGEGMMHLYAKLTSLSLEENMYVVHQADKIDDVTVTLRANVCRSTGPNAVQMFADSWNPPKLMSRPRETAKWSNKFDNKGKFPTISRSIIDSTEDFESF